MQSLPDIAWGKRSRVILDVGCGVASFGGFLFDRDVLAMSFAPKDEHEAQVQFALERGIPAISAVMGTKRLPFPSSVYDLVHCARCRVPWHIEGNVCNLFIYFLSPHCSGDIIRVTLQVVNFSWSLIVSCDLVVTLSGLLLLFTKSFLKMLAFGKVEYFLFLFSFFPSL